MVNGGTNMFDKSFQEITNNIKNMVSKTQLDIMLDANSKLIKLYYNIGKTISDNYEWGNKFIDNLALELKLSFPKSSVSIFIIYFNNLFNDWSICSFRKCCNFNRAL